MKNKLFLFLVISIGFGSCSNSTWQDPSPHTTSFITIKPGINLELLDWGGKGEPILFLAGLGNTAHVFDEFAPLFTDQFHVLGLTRRGFGASSQPPSGYNDSTLANDILLLIDQLKIKRITLIGHSIAGEEMTKFASIYPDRINRLVYIDAAYDRTANMAVFEKAPPPPKLTAKDSASLSSVQKYYKSTYGISMNEAEMRAGCIFAKDGHFVRDATPDTIYNLIIKFAERPSYNAIKAPALAFYQIADSLRDIFSYLDKLDSTERSNATEVFQAGQLFQRKQIDMFKNEMTSGKVIEIHHANHFLFLTNVDEVAGEIRKFLLP